MRNCDAVGGKSSQTYKVTSCSRPLCGRHTKATTWLLGEKHAVRTTQQYDFLGEKQKKTKSALWRDEFFKRCLAALPSADMWKLTIGSASFPVQTNWPWPVLCAAGSDAVTETDKLKWQPYWGDRAVLSLVHRSQPLTVTAAWGRLYDDCIDPRPQKHSVFDILPTWSVYSLRYGAQRIV